MRHPFHLKFWMYKKTSVLPLSVPVVSCNLVRAFPSSKFLTHLVDPSHVVKHMETLSGAQWDIFVAVFHDRINPTIF